MARPTAEAVLERMRLFSGGPSQTPESDTNHAASDGAVPPGAVPPGGDSADGTPDQD